MPPRPPFLSVFQQSVCIWSTIWLLLNQSFGVVWVWCSLTEIWQSLTQSDSKFWNRDRGFTRSEFVNSSMQQRCSLDDWHHELRASPVEWCHSYPVLYSSWLFISDVAVALKCLRHHENSQAIIQNKTAAAEQKEAILAKEWNSKTCSTSFRGGLDHILTCKFTIFLITFTVSMSGCFHHWQGRVYVRYSCRDIQDTSDSQVVHPTYAPRREYRYHPEVSQFSGTCIQGSWDTIIQGCHVQLHTSFGLSQRAVPVFSIFANRTVSHISVFGRWGSESANRQGGKLQFGQYYLHTFYWNYLDYGDSSNARLTVRVDYDRDIYSGSNNNKKFYTFTFQASQAWREDREADRRFVKEKLALTMAMAKHQRLGASSTCHLKLIPDDVMRKIVFLCLQWKN